MPPEADQDSRVADQDSRVEFLLDGHTYALADGKEGVLADELRGYAEGRFPDEVAGVIRSELAGLHWTDGAVELAEEITKIRAGGREGPVRVEGKTIETLRAALRPIVAGDGGRADSAGSGDSRGAAELLAALQAFDCKVCWGLGWTPSFAVAGSPPGGDQWLECHRCAGTGTRSKTGAQRPKPSEPPQRHRAA